MIRDELDVVDDDGDSDDNSLFTDLCIDVFATEADIALATESKRTENSLIVVILSFR